MKQTIRFVLALAILSAASPVFAQDFHCLPADGSKAYGVSMNAAGNRGEISYKDGTPPSGVLIRSKAGDVSRLALDKAKALGLLPYEFRKFIDTATSYYVQAWSNDRTSYYLIVPKNWRGAKRSTDHFPVGRMIIEKKRLGLFIPHFHKDLCALGK